MALDHIRYDILTQNALRGVMRTVLADVAKNGLPGEHHFSITFNTMAPGVRLSERLRAQYPEAMTIILQHQFWDLAVGDDAFEVGLSFGGIPERLAVPFDAVSAFYDPAVQFGFQFETVESQAASNVSTAPSTDDKAAGTPKRPPAEQKNADALPVPAPTPTGVGSGSDANRGNGGEVVRLDRFRKKT